MAALGSIYLKRKKIILTSAQVWVYHWKQKPVSLTWLALWAAGMIYHLIFDNLKFISGLRVISDSFPEENIFA
jgi:hypothetical protein